MATLTLTAADVAGATGLRLTAGDQAAFCAAAASAYGRDAELWARSLVGGDVYDAVVEMDGGAAAEQDAYDDLVGAVAKLAAAEAAYPGTLRSTEGGAGFISSTGWDQSRESLLRAPAMELPVAAWVGQALRRLHALPGAPEDPATVPVYAYGHTGALDTRPTWGRPTRDDAARGVGATT